MYEKKRKGKKKKKKKIVKAGYSDDQLRITTHRAVLASQTFAGLTDCLLPACLPAAASIIGISLPIFLKLIKKKINAAQRLEVAAVDLAIAYIITYIILQKPIL